MKAHGAGLIVIAALTLAACGRGGPGARGDAGAQARQAWQTVQDQGGAVRTMGMPLPGRPPRYAPIPQDSFITAVDTDALARSGNVEFSTPLAPAAVRRIYQLAADQAGLEPAKAPDDHDAWATAAGQTVLTVAVQPVEGVGANVRLTYR